MTKIEKLLVFLVSTIVAAVMIHGLTACGDNGPLSVSSPPPSPSPAPSAQDAANASLQGNTYTTACTQWSGNNVTWDVSFNGGFTYALNLYTDPACTPANEAFSISITGTYVLSAPDSNGNFPIDFTYVNYYLTTYNGFGAALSGSNVCGVSTFTDGTPTDITTNASDNTNGCLAGSGLVFTTRYDLVSVFATQLLFGLIGDPSYDQTVPANRPVTTDATTPFLK